MDLSAAIAGILRAHRMALTPDQITQVVDLLRAQKKTLAVAWLQQGTGASLPEALQAIEAIDQVLKTT